jgi:hypothetical protein
MKSMKWGAGILGAVIAAGLIVYAVLGTGGKASAASPFDRTQYDQLLAAQLGITVDKLHAAETAARNQLIDQLQQQGKITADQANKLKSAPSGGFPGPGFSGRPGSGRGSFLMTDVMTVAAQKMGITADALRQALQGGKSLAQVGADHGISRDVLKTTIVNAENADLQKATANGSITQAQANQIASNIPNMVDRLLDRTGRGGGNGGPGFRGPRGNPASPNPPGNNRQ